MRRLLPALLLSLSLIACSGSVERDLPAEESAPPPQVAADASMERASGPDVGPTAAPGVAFNYRYAFRLPADRISPVQEQHARTCEELGITRCRITGMRYRVISEDDIEAMLAFKLDPAIARRFGRAGIDAVTRADGMLTESEISGVEVGGAITRATRDIAQMNEELRRIERRLAGRLSNDDRAQLEYQAQQLRQAIRAAQAGREEQQESLATTPMVFNYGSGDLVPGPRGRPSLNRELARAGDNFVDGLVVLTIILVTLAPWVLLAALVWWAVRIVRRRLRKPPVEGEAVS